MNEIIKVFNDRLQSKEDAFASSIKHSEECLIKSLSMVLSPVEENEEFFNFDEISVIYEDYCINSISTIRIVDYLQREEKYNKQTYFS